jgi:predicted ribosomally synthesized peptide with SipW-like signal peptide
MRDLSRRHLSRILVVLLVTGVVAASLGVASNAIWTDSADVDANVFSTGTLDIETDHSTEAVVTYTDMAPGDSTGGQSLTVTNAGSLDLRYAVTMTADNIDLKDLYAELELTITEEGTDCTTFDGDVLYGPDPFLLTGNLIGDPGQGEDPPGDRTLTTASPSEVLCFKVDLPIDAPNSVQDASTTAVFTFEAEQTDNNP